MKVCSRSPRDVWSLKAAFPKGAFGGTAEEGRFSCDAVYTKDIFGMLSPIQCPYGLLTGAVKAKLCRNIHQIQSDAMRAWNSDLPRFENVAVLRP